MKHRLLMIGMIVFCLGMFYMATGPPVMTAQAADTQVIILAPGFNAAITALPASNVPVSLSLKELEQEYITNLINDCESQRHDDLNSGNCSALTNTSIRYNTITAFTGSASMPIIRHDDDRNCRAASCKTAFGKKTPVCIV